MIRVTLDSNIYVSALQFGGIGMQTTTASLSALAAGSDCIVTYDQDLLRLGEYAGIKIVSAVDFLQRGMEP